MNTLQASISFRINRVGLGYFQDKGFLQFYSMVEGSSRREFSSFRFIEDFGIFGILWGKFLFHFLGGLGQGHRGYELSDVGVVLSQHSVKSCHIPLLGINSSSKLRVIFLHGMKVSQEVSLFEYLWVIMPWDRGSSNLDCPSHPVDDQVCFG